MMDMGKEQRQRLIDLLIKLEARDSGDSKEPYGPGKLTSGFAMPEFGGQEHTDAKTLQHLGWIRSPHLGMSLENTWFAEGILALDLTKDGRAALANWRTSNESLENTADTGSISTPTLRGQPGSNDGARVFIGHGRSHIWMELKIFLEERLGLAVEEYSRVSNAGRPTTTRLQEMTETSSAAFLLMTGEDETADGSTRARENVVHEVGLFQGRLGLERAVVLLEEGCTEFSNIVGLGQIRFPKGNISAVFEEIRLFLEREGLTG